MRLSVSSLPLLRSIFRIGKALVSGRSVRSTKQQYIIFTPVPWTRPVARRQTPKLVLTCMKLQHGSSSSYYLWLLPTALVLHV